MSRFTPPAGGTQGASEYHASRITHHASRRQGHASVTHHVLPLIPLIIFIISLHSYYTNETYFKDDAAGVADWLAVETTPNDVVYVDVPHPFHYYVAKGLIPAPTRYLFVDIHTASDILTRETAGRDRLYWVTWSGSDTDPRGVIPFLAEKFGRQLGQRDFRGYHVEWFNLPKTNTAFSLPNTLTPINATFGDVLRLDGIAYGDTATVDNPTWATLHFTLLRETDVDYKVSLRLHNEEGNPVYQFSGDKDLLNDRHFRTSAWPLNDSRLNQTINVYILPIPAQAPPGDYSLEVVVYAADTLQPLPITGTPESSCSFTAADGISALVGQVAVSK